MSFTEPTAPLATRRDRVYLIAALFVLAMAMVAEITGPKIFAFHQLVGWRPFGLELNLSAGILCWPLVFITTDVINHYFGKAGVLRITWVVFGFLAFTYLVLFVTTELPPAAFWLEASGRDGEGRFLDINYAYRSIFRTSLGIVIGSLIAFVVSQVVDATAYAALRKRLGPNQIGLLATLSTLVSQLVDSYLILFIAFGLLGNWSAEQIVAVGTTQFLFKFSVAVLAVPLLYLTRGAIDRYLAGERAATGS